MRGKIFTAEEARKMVPLVRRIVRDVRARTRLVERGGLEARAREALEREILECTQELESLGCALRDSQVGLVECYGELQGEIVFFRWQPGEEAFIHWRPLDSPPTVRRPLAERLSSFPGG